MLLFCFSPNAFCVELHLLHLPVWQHVKKRAHCGPCATFVCWETYEADGLWASWAPTHCEILKPLFSEPWSCLEESKSPGFVPAACSHVRGAIRTQEGTDTEYRFPGMEWQIKSTAGRADGYPASEAVSHFVLYSALHLSPLSLQKFPTYLEVVSSGCVQTEQSKVYFYLAFALPSQTPGELSMLLICIRQPSGKVLGGRTRRCTAALLTPAWKVAPWHLAALQHLQLFLCRHLPASHWFKHLWLRLWGINWFFYDQTFRLLCSSRALVVILSSKTP